jgi:hypothetical protein
VKLNASLEDNRYSFSQENHIHFKSEDLLPKSMRWSGHKAQMRTKGNACSVLVGKPEWRRPLRRPIRKWKNNIKMDLREIGQDGWTGFLWLRIGTNGGSCEHGNEQFYTATHPDSTLYATRSTYERNKKH